MKVFVYGTLKKGFYFSSYLKDAEFLGPAKTSLDYTLYVEALPHMVLEPSKTGVKGELYVIDQNTLEALDKLEGHPLFYRREVIEVTDKDNQKVLCWAYIASKNFKGKSNAFIEEEFL